MYPPGSGALFPLVLMLGLPSETVAQILAALSYTDIATTVGRVCRTWHAQRTSTDFCAIRAAVDERGLMVAEGHYGQHRYTRLWHVLVGGRWHERTPLPHKFNCASTFRGELVVVGHCSRPLAFNLEANTWRELALEWNDDEFVDSCCATDAVVVALSGVNFDDNLRLRSLRPGSAEGWVSVPNPPVEVLSDGFPPPAIYFVEDLLYVVGESALQTFDFSTRAWTVCAPLPHSRRYPVCVQHTGRLYVAGGLGGANELLREVVSYDPRKDQWRSESPLPLGGYGVDAARAGHLRTVVHEGRVVVIGIEGTPPLVLVDDVWTELPPFPKWPSSSDAVCTVDCVFAASLSLGY